jgi:predicted NAD/FAD-binding protein
MNRLQPLAGDRPVFVSLNPPIEPKGIIHEETFAHPQFDDTAMRVQRPLWSLQGTRHTWFAGAWLGAGFHEDGLEAGLTVAELLGGKRRPWDLPEGPSRIPKIQRIQG